MPAKECPMCGEVMHLRETVVTDRVPGTVQTKSTKTPEWVCPECRFTLVALHLEHGRAPFLRHLDSRIFQMHHVHLQCLHKEVLVVPTAGTGQRHADILFRRQSQLPKT